MTTPTASRSPHAANVVELSELWGQPVVVDNRSGAQGNVGTAAGAKAAPDGYTITLAHQGALVINPHMYKDTGFDTLKDFAPVARATEMAFLGVAGPNIPVTNLRELAQYAKQNPARSRSRRARPARTSSANCSSSRRART